MKHRVLTHIVILTHALVIALAGCQGQPASVAPPNSLAQPPKASALVTAATKATAQAKAQVTATAIHLDAAASATTLPQAQVDIAAAKQSNAAAGASVGAVGDSLAIAAPAAQAQEHAGSACEVKLAATQSYEWLRIMLISAGTAAAALLALFAVACMFASVASSTVLAAIPVVGPLIAGARSALYLVMGELVVVIATCAYLAAHIVAAVNFGFAIAAAGAVYLCVRFALKHHLAAKVGPAVKTVEADIKPAGLWIEHKIAAAWHWLANKFLPAKKAAPLAPAAA